MNLDRELRRSSPMAPDAGGERSSVIPIRPIALTVLLEGIALLLLVADLALQTIDVRTESNNLVWEQIVRLFDLNSESSIPTWYSVVLLFTATMITLAIAINRHRAGDRFSRHWFLFSLLILGFSIDESAQIHDAPSREPLRDILGTGGLLYYPWVVGAIVGIVVVGFLAYGFFRHLPRRTAGLLIASAAVFISGAIVLETLSGFYLSRHDEADLTSMTISSFEEFLELSGAVILIYALLDYGSSQLKESTILWNGSDSGSS
ncbi:MAG: hypothetical protein R3A46_03475 [Thermomicrobiales bacterium]